MDEQTSRILQTFGFDADTFESLRAKLRGGAMGAETNRIPGEVTPPTEGDIRPLPPLGDAARARLAARGAEAIAAGEVGLVVLAGGMATRFGGVVKAAVDVVDGRSFLELKLLDAQHVAATTGGRIPVYLMTSFATHEVVKELAAPLSTPSCPVESFPQFVSLRLTPEGAIFHDADGRPSPYAPGHGDLSFALRRAGILERFRAGGGRLLMMSNVDNVTATLDPAVVGAHLESGAAVTVEVAPKHPGDKGGAPARVDGRLQVVESFRFPEGFDQDSIPVFNTNTLVLDAAAIDRHFPLTWFVVRKKVDGAEVVQFERLVGELTAFLETAFLRIERTGDDARFQPVKDPEELAARRPEIEAALRARGVLP